MKILYGVQLWAQSETLDSTSVLSAQQPGGMEGHSRLFPVCGDRDMPVRVSLIRKRRAGLLPATLHSVSANTKHVSAMDQQCAVQ